MAGEVASNEMEDQQRGRRKWFKRFSSVETRQRGDSQPKQRSRSILARLCFASKRKTHKNRRPEIEIFRDDEDDETSPADSESLETAEISDVVESPSFPDQSSPDIPNEKCESCADVAVAGDRSTDPTGAETEIEDSIAKIKQDWLEFGKSLGINEKEMTGIMESAEIGNGTDEAEGGQMTVSEATRKHEENEAKMQKMLKEAPSLVLGSFDDSGSRCDFQMKFPVGMDLGEKRCASLGWITRRHSEVQEENGVVSMASAKGVQALSSHHETAISEGILKSESVQPTKGVQALSSHHETEIGDGILKSESAQSTRIDSTSSGCESATSSVVSSTATYSSLDSCTTVSSLTTSESESQETLDDTTTTNSNMVVNAVSLTVEESANSVTLPPVTESGQRSAIDSVEAAKTARLAEE